MQDKKEIDPYKIAHNYKPTGEPIPDEILKERRVNHLCKTCGGIEGSVLNMRCKCKDWYCIYHQCPLCKNKIY